MAISSEKALEAAKVIVDFCNEQRGCQNCIFRLYGADHWKCHMYAFDLDEIKVCVDRQYKNCHGYSGSKKAIYREAILAVKSILHSAKPLDAVPVLRCRDCKYWGDGDGKLQGSDGALFARCKQ